MDINRITGNQPNTGTAILKDASPTGERSFREATPQSAEKETIELSRENLKSLADALNSAANALDKRIAFSFNEKINRVVLKVINTENNEVVREIPPRELVRVYEHIHELIGMFVDESR
jgi:flagellar protein FlaG